MPCAFSLWLERLARLLRIEDVSLTLYDESQQGVLAQWDTYHVDPHPGFRLPIEFPSAAERVKTEGVIVLQNSEDMPAGSEHDRASLVRHGLGSAVFVPLKSGGHMDGLIVIMTRTTSTEWGEPLLGKLRIAADVFANALARMRAETALRESRDHLARLTRVSAMGELAASLAHELNQPLTGILSNAQAARHLLEATERDERVELQNIVRDVAEDAMRAGDVVWRMRDLLRKSATELAPVDLNELVTLVAKIVTSDSIIRQVSLRLDLSPHAPTVKGDRVQLQQVVLNLLLNALDAASTSDHHPRLVLVKTEAIDHHPIHLFVRDTGPGLLPGSEHRVFEPFYTTKKSGTGMGLAIARSIVEAHGGSIWAATDRDGGAEFHLTLPVSEPIGTQTWTS
jgi:signal transduction histidine kinase